MGLSGLGDTAGDAIVTVEKGSVRYRSTDFDRCEASSLFIHRNDGS